MKYSSEELLCSEAFILEKIINLINHLITYMLKKQFVYFIGYYKTKKIFYNIVTSTLPLFQWL